MPVTKAKPRSKRRASRLTDRRWTFEELAAELPESNLPKELWDGKLLLSDAPSFFHQEIVDRFHDLLKGWVRPRCLGKTVASPIDMVLTSRWATQPDVVLISNERPHIIEKSYDEQNRIVSFCSGPARLPVVRRQPGWRWPGRRA